VLAFKAGAFIIGM